MGMPGPVSGLDRERRELKTQVGYWKGMHRWALSREEKLKEKIARLEGVIHQQEMTIKEKEGQIEALKAKIVWFQNKVFGRSSEKGFARAPSSPEDREEFEGRAKCSTSINKRKRGKQAGAKGFGRKFYEGLLTEEVFHDLPESKRECPHCHKPFTLFFGTEDSSEIHWEVNIIRCFHRRRRYRRACDCKEVPGIVTAPAPMKMIPKGLFSSGFWAQVLLEKFLLQRPLHRILKRLRLEGLEISQGTLTGGLKKIADLLKPLYTKIIEQNRKAHHWWADETSWSVFAEAFGSKSYQWWLWVFVTDDTCVYLLDPSRGKKIPKGHLGDQAEGIINADRLGAYKSIGEKVRVAFCWGHIRRDFIKIRDGYKKLYAWGHAWVRRINGLFALNARRLLEPLKSEAFAFEDQKVRLQVTKMEEVLKKQLGQDDWHPEQTKALKSLSRHWAGATLFVDYPDIPMDNNESERRLRNPVVGRKNYYGSGSLWSGQLAAILFTLFETLLINEKDPKEFLLSYFEACAQNKGKVPKNLDDFLPWKRASIAKAA